MRLFTFTDYDGRERTVPVYRIVDVRKSSGRVHDFGSVRVDTGGPPLDISFGSDSGYPDARLALRETPDPV